MNTSQWKKFLSNRSNVTMVTVTAFTLALTLVSYTRFLTHVETRGGFVFVDPLHMLIGPVDLTWPIFCILYGALIAAIVLLMRNPELLFRALRAYTMLIGLRMICMWLLPLDPPATMVVLHDPFVELFAGSTAQPLTRDLFFSGHTSILCLVGFVLPKPWMRRSFFVAATAIGMAVLLQHVHYTIDVVVAPMAAYTAAALSGALHRR